MFVEIKYLNLLSPRLQKFSRKKDFLWNFRCPYCGDSTKNKNKARGFVFQIKGDLVYKCHNCGISVPLGKLIQDQDPQLYKEYQLEKFQNSNKPRVDMRKVKKVVSSKPTFKKNVLNGLSKLDDLNNSHPAREYILDRRLPTEALYYTEKFKEWTNSIKPNTFQDVTQDEGRIIIPFRTKEGDVFGYQGRSLSNSGLRYITILLEEDQPKIFGLDKIDYEERIYITEGPLDSLLLRNCVAMAGADISLSSILGDNVVYIYDNEPRNRQITKRIEQHIDAGQSVVIWPKHIIQKDINEMVLGGLCVQNLVESNTYIGLTAKLKFNEWKK
jgi:DNA-directed RNA polymerase subunit RPC12/RpoP